MNLSEFFHMGGYAFFVWSSYGVTALFMMIELILLVRKKRTLMQRIARIVRMQSEN